MELKEIGWPTLEGKIEFIYRQCAMFAAAREGRLPTMKFDRMNLCTDRQDYMVNWVTKKDRATIQLTAVATADADSGYVFGLQPNFDDSVSPEWLETKFASCGDPQRPPHLRQYARFWTKDDYERSKQQNAEAGQNVPGSREGDLIDAEGTARADLESTEAIIAGQALPKHGAQIHADYLVHGHFQLLRMLLPGVKKFRFFMDRDLGLLAACIGAFADKMKVHDAEIVQVGFDKTLTNDQRLKLIKARKEWFEEESTRFPRMSSGEIRFELMREAVVKWRAENPLPDRRKAPLLNPLPDSAEVLKTFTYVTDTDHLSDDQMTWLFLRSTLWPLDTVFNMLRRRVATFERPVQSVKRARRMWHIYAPYNPVRVIQLLEIFRVWRNYIWISQKDKKSPAQRLGLAAGEIRFDHILGFDCRKEVLRHFENGG